MRVCMCVCMCNIVMINDSSCYKNSHIRGIFMRVSECDVGFERYCNI